MTGALNQHFRLLGHAAITIRSNNKNQTSILATAQGICQYCHTEVQFFYQITRKKDTSLANQQVVLTLCPHLVENFGETDIISINYQILHKLTCCVLGESVCLDSLSKRLLEQKHYSIDYLLIAFSFSIVSTVEMVITGVHLR